jgi:hypothetical protein
MRDPSINERRPPLEAFHTAHRKATLWLGATAGTVALLLAIPAMSHAEEANPNNYNCLGNLAAGTAEAGSDEHQVQYSFYCNGPITGYQVQSQVPVTGIQSPPVLTDVRATPLTDTFACSGEIPGYAVDCVGAAKGSYETINGQFAIGTALCAEPRVDALLTVTYAFLEKGAVVQAISGPFELGRPKGCRPDGFSGGNRLNPKVTAKPHRKSAKKAHKKAVAKTKKK